MSIDPTQRLLDATIGSLELLTVHLGVELGLYADLDRHGPATAAQLADRAGIAERYAQEWLEQQAVAGYLRVAGGDDAESRVFELPAEHRGALVDPIHADHLAPLAPMVVGIAGVMSKVVDAYRTGGGVPFADYGEALREGQGGINRPAFSSDLVKAWLPAVAGVADRLSGGGRLLDVGSGLGWSTIAIQSAWPAAEVIGLDTDVASVEGARRNADAAGVDVRFEVADSTGGGMTAFGPVDVVTILEALHDMARPAEVLASARAALAPGGIVVIADEAVAETFTAPGDEIERMMYGWSVLHCLPAAMAEQPSAAIGTCIRPHTVAEVAAEAGFTSCEVVDVDGGFFRIYRLTA